MANKIKRWYYSKTIWLAILQAVAGLLTATLSQYPELKGVGVIMVGKSLLDFAIRFITKEPIKSHD